MRWDSCDSDTSNIFQKISSYSTLPGDCTCQHYSYVCTFTPHGPNRKLRMEKCKLGGGSYLHSGTVHSSSISILALDTCYNLIMTTA